MRSCNVRWEPSTDSSIVIYLDVDVDAKVDSVIVINGGVPAEELASEPAEEEMFSEEPEEYIQKNVIIWFIAILAFDILLFSFLTLRNRRKARAEAQGSTPSERLPLPASERSLRSSILLFGDFKVVDANGEDIAGRLSPTLQELFLLLLCHTPEGGISSASLKECLWYDKDASSARNNRAVYMTKLKKMLEGVGECSIVRNGEFWKFEAEGIYIDLYTLFDIVSTGQNSVAAVKKVVGILSSGTFLAHQEGSEWSDRIKARVADSVMSYLESFLTTFNIKDNPELAISVADALFSLDSMNEAALTAKCKAYREMGNHAMSKKLFATFLRDYSELYGEEFDKSFSDILSD
jgi:Response regulator containing CheY-like receiver and SARP domains